MTSPDREHSVRIGLYLTAAVYGLTFWYHPAHDPDLGWHLVGGAWIVRHGAVPDADFINTFNPLWHDYHWLAQVALYALYSLGSYELLRFALGGLMAFLGVVIMDVLVRHAPRPLPVAAIVAAFLGAMSLVGAVTSVRPQMISVCVLAVAVHRLMQTRRRWELPLLFGLTALLVNVHIYWIFIPFLWALYRCVPRVLGAPQASAAYVWGGLAVLTAAGVVSPYGALRPHVGEADLLLNYALVWDLFQTPAVLKDTIFEFRSGLAADGATPWLLVAYAALFARSLQWRRIVEDLPSLLAFAIAGALSLGGLKYTALFAVLGLPWMARYVVADVAALLPAAVAAIGVPVLGLTIGASLLHAAWYFPWTAPNNEYINEWCPIDACRAIARMDLHPRAPRDHIRVATHFNNGGWCRWVLYQERPDVDYRVTTDGRTQAVPAQRIVDSFNMYQMKGDALATLARWAPDVILVHQTSALVNFLRLAPQDYALEFQDDNFAVFRPLH